MASTAKEDVKKEAQPQLLKLDYAFKLAEQWVSSMSKSKVNDKSPSVELEGRPSRLGIGATVPKESKFTRSSNSIERKLLGKLNNAKKKVAMEQEGLTETPPAENGKADEDSEDEESESKAKAFAKKRPPSSSFPLHGKKRRHR